MQKLSKKQREAKERELLILHERELRAARKGNLMSFTKLTKPNYEVAWHHQKIAEVLSAFARKEIKRLMIFAPPQHGKSELASRRLPAMLQGMYPNDSILACSYNASLAADMTIDTQRIMDTAAYREIFPLSQITAEGKVGKYSRTSNEHELIPVQLPDKYWFIPEGIYRSAGVDGSFTGRPGDWLLIDDPYKNRADADSKVVRDSILKNYSSTLKTRMRGEGQIMIMHTRWHDDDLAGNLLRLGESDPNADQWSVLVMPALRVDMESSWDPRKLGEELWPNRFPMKVLLANKATNERDFAALYQQTPQTEGGNIIKSDWIKYYKTIPTKFDTVIQSWDFAVKDKKTSDFTVGQVWGRSGLEKYLLYQVRGRWDFPTACQKVIDVTRLFPRAHKKVIEAKANGPAIMQMLKTKVTGLVECTPTQDKVSRLNAIAPDYQSGHVWYPDPSIAPWIQEHVSELCAFPGGVNDDQVDAASQALDQLRNTGPLYMPISGHGSGTIY